MKKARRKRRLRKKIQLGDPKFIRLFGCFTGTTRKDEIEGEYKKVCTLNPEFKRIGKIWSSEAKVSDWFEAKRVLLSLHYLRELGQSEPRMNKMLRQLDRLISDLNTLRKIVLEAHPLLGHQSRTEVFKNNYDVFLSELSDIRSEVSKLRHYKKGKGNRSQIIRSTILSQAAALRGRRMVLKEEHEEDPKRLEHPSTWEVSKEIATILYGKSSRENTQLVFESIRRLPKPMLV